MKLFKMRTQELKLEPEEDPRREMFRTESRKLAATLIPDPEKVVNELFVAVFIANGNITFLAHGHMTPEDIRMDLMQAVDGIAPAPQQKPRTPTPYARRLKVQRR